jgi:hypothetical protein
MVLHATPGAVLQVDGWLRHAAAVLAGSPL